MKATHGGTSLHYFATVQTIGQMASKPVQGLPQETLHLEDDANRVVFPSNAVPRSLHHHLTTCQPFHAIAEVQVVQASGQTAHIQHAAQFAWVGAYTLL